jgi:acyl-CoA thioesterase-1
MTAILLASLLAASPAAAACKLTVLGDSLTAGLGVAIPDAFPAQLERALQTRGTSCAVVDAGVSGDTSAGGASRIEWVLADQPSHLLVELGANDALRALPVEQMATNLGTIVETAQKAGVKVMLVGMMAPPNLGKDYGERFTAVYRDLAQRYQIPLYPFFLDGLVGRPELIQRDGLHPKAEGVAVVVEKIAGPVASWLGGAP